MALRDYAEDIQLYMNDLYVVICVNQKPGTGSKSPVNQLLVSLMEELKEEIPYYEAVRVAYVYENPSMMTARPFTCITQDSEVFYKEPCMSSGTHNLNHIFFMGMAMLEEQKIMNPMAECRLYLVTDEKFERMNQIVWQEGEKTILNPRFANLDVKFRLFKGEGTGGDLLEEYMKNASL